MKAIAKFIEISIESQKIGTDDDHAFVEFDG